MALKDCGGMWTRQGSKGEFLSGKFQPEGKDGPSFSFMAFRNHEAKNKQPDWRLMMADDDEQQTPRPEKAKPFTKPSDDDVPF